MQAQTNNETLAEQVAETFRNNTLDEHVEAVDASDGDHERSQYIDIYGGDAWFESNEFDLSAGIHQTLDQHNAFITGIESGEFVDSSMRIWFRQIAPPVEFEYKQS